MWDVGAAAIRTVDTQHAIWFEGVTWDWFNVGFKNVPGGDAWKNKSVLSYHFYVPPDFNAQTQLSARMDDMKRLGCGGFLTESMPDRSIFDDLDQYKQGWMIWEYKPFVGNKTGWATSIWYNNGTMNMEMASMLSRTYAQVVAGVAQTVRYSTSDYSFILIFQADPQYVTANTTKIYLNEALHYPNGFNVVATTTAGPSAVSWSHVAANHIEVVHNPLLVKNGLVTVEIAAL
jgi:endoglycosylceramidase